jgi:hypothetical protein
MTTGFFTADREPALSLEIRGPDGAQSHGASRAIRTAPPCSSLSILTGPEWAGATPPRGRILDSLVPSLSILTGPGWAGASWQ